MKQRILCWALIFCLTLALLPATALASPPPVTLLEISDAIAPINGGTPVTTIAETDQYTGVVEWSGGGTEPWTVFEAEEDYTATITLTAKDGYTFEGVEENAFTVTSAKAATNPADSGVITATFMSPPEGYITDGGGVMAYRYDDGDFDIQGFFHNGWKQTTYASYGYGTEVKVGDGSNIWVDATGEPEYIGDTDLTIDIDLAFVSEGKALQVRYTLKNNGSQGATFSFGSHADVQIGGDDSAPIEVFDMELDPVSENRGFKMISNDEEDINVEGDHAQFNFFGKRSVGVTDVDTFWYGNWSSRQANVFNQIDQPSYSGDSGMAYSWKNRTIGAGETQIYTVVIGIGGAESSDVVDDTSDTSDFIGYCSFVVTATAGAGGSISPSGAVSVDDMSDAAFTITPDAGYAIADVLVDGKSVGAVDSYILQSVRYSRTIAAVFEQLTDPVEEDPVDENPFDDVTEDDWFFDAVLDAYRRGLLLGTDDGIFDPNGACTRGMIPTILFRMESSPDVPEIPEGDGFSDVLADQWYTDAVNWSAGNEIVLGFEENSFAPGLSVTREQLAAMFYRYAQYKGWDVSASGDLSAFVDGEDVSSWALEAVKWAVGKGLMQGKDGGAFDPQGIATRAEVATFLMKFLAEYNPDLTLSS